MNKPNKPPLFIEEGPSKKKLKINSKKKGSRYERDVCKLLQTWTGFEFARVPSSGGLRWKNTDNTTGDITCSDGNSRKFPFSVECKFYKEINFEHLLLDVKSDIIKFWEQSLSDSERSGKIPLVFMKYNGMRKDDHFIIIPTELYEHLELDIKNLKFKGEFTFTIINYKNLIKYPYEYKTFKKYLRTRN